MNFISIASWSAVGVAFLLPVQTSADDWPQWRGPDRDGVWHETVQLAPGPGLAVAWRASIGAGWSSPVIAQGRVYVTDAELARPNAKERLLCFNEMSGSLVWKHEYPVAYPDWAFDPGSGGPRATPMVEDRRVFILGALGNLFCFDAATGAVLWSKDLAKEYEVKEFTGITASPLIDDGLLILYMCGKPAACVVAFDKRSGKEAWRALDDSFTYSSPIVIRAGGQKQLIVWTQEAVTSLDPRTGRTWWRELTRISGDQAISTPVFSDGRLLVGGLMFKLDPDKPAASVLWPDSRAPSRRVLSNTSTALVRDGYVYSARISGELVCLDAATGKEVWQTNAVTGPGNGSSIHITPSGDTVYLFTDEGNLIRARLTPDGYHEFSRGHLLDPTSPFGARKRAWVPPAFANGHAFARNDLELVSASLGSKGRGKSSGEANSTDAEKGTTGGLANAQQDIRAASAKIRVLEPPEKEFFSKVLDFHGVPIKAPAVVVDEALFAAYDRLALLFTNLLARQPEVLSNLVAARVELHIIGRNQVTTDLPEWRHDKGVPRPEYNGLTRDQRTRGMGGRLTSCGEENLLKLEKDRYRGRDICLHEFSHCVLNFGCPRDIRARVREQHQRSLAQGLWVKSYAGSNADEFFAELTMWYFGTHGDLNMTGPKPANGREGLKRYDPEAFALMDDFYTGRIPIGRIERGKKP